jgi:acetoin utilization protein AcuC
MFTREKRYTGPMKSNSNVCVYVGEALAAYGFGEGHPFGPDRMGVFWQRMVALGLDQRVLTCEPQRASDEQILEFHSEDYLDRVKQQSELGTGYLDLGDTPAYKGIYEAAATVVGTTLAALDSILEGRCRQAFVPIAGLHHAKRGQAAGFCVFNDCGVAIETLRRRYAVRRVAYVDIDAHHGDGVFYAFEDDPDLCIVDLHEDGRYLYPGSGGVGETGTGVAVGTKLNIPMPPNAGDDSFFRVWERAEAFVRQVRPEFILLQCGADSLAGDPITHLNYSAAAHRHAAQRLKRLAEESCHGRLLALGGGGYNRNNLAEAWTAVVAALLGASD